jgi:hypothetical protein
LGLFSRLISAALDPNQPILVGVLPHKANKKINLCYLKQNDVKIEAVKDTIAQPVEVDLGAGQKSMNWIETTKAFDLILEEMNPRFAENAKIVPVQAAPTQSAEPEEDPYPMPDDEHVQ